MSRVSRVTPFSLLALAVGLIGGAATLGLAHLWLVRWVEGGDKFAIGRNHQTTFGDADLSALVYYESDESVGNRVTLRMNDVYGERVRVGAPDEDHSFEVSGRQGKALFKLTLEEPGTYHFRCDNPHYASDADTPAGDRIVFRKSPQAWDDVLGVRSAVLAIGGSLTIGLALALYVAHGVTLARRKGRGGT